MKRGKRGTKKKRESGVGTNENPKSKGMLVRQGKPKTISNVPIIVTTSAKRWPRDKASIP